jgi:CHAT domain-containing protein/tetratricopeptide (TPR) repeat protein
MRRPHLARCSLSAALVILCIAPTTASDRSYDPAPSNVTYLIDAGRYDEALVSARERLAAIEAATGPDAPEVARAIGLVVKAGYWCSRPKDPDLLALARRAVAIDERASGPGSLETAESLSGLAFILLARGDDDEVKGLCDRALAIREKAAGPESLEAATSHRCLGLVSEDRGDLQAALAENARALAIQEKDLGPDAPDVAATLNSLASVQRQLGDYPRAIESRTRCLAIREKAFGPDHPQVAWAIHNLANLHADLGEYARARELYLRALAIRERIEPPDHPDLGYSHNSLGLMAYDLGDYTAARHEYERALAIRERSLGPEHALVAASLNNLGNLLDDIGEPEEARDLLTRALDIKTRKLGPDHAGTATTANNLGNVLAELGEFDRSEELTRRALAAREKALGPDHPDVGRSLDDLGWLRDLRGDPASGLPFLERALAIREKALGADHPDVAGTLERIAIARLESGDAAAALAPARRALGIQRRVFGTDHPAVAGTLALIGSIERCLGDAAGALDAARESESIRREHFRLTARHLSEREALRYEQVRASGLDVALETLARGADDPAVASRAAAVLDDVIRSRALVLDAIASRRRQAAGTHTEEESRRIAALGEAATALARLVRREPDPDHPERYLTQVSEARERKERAERDLVEVSPTEREWAEGGRIGLDGVRGALPEGAILLSYVRVAAPSFSGSIASVAVAEGEASYAAFITAGGATGTTRIVRLGPASRIDGLVARWRVEAARGATGPSVSLRRLEAAYRDAAAALREAIWDPVAPGLSGSSLVFVVPDGALDVVSLETLPAGLDRYLIEAGPALHYLSSERDLIAAGRPRAGGAGLLVVGGADYGPSSARSTSPAPCSPFGSLRFAPLPGAREEADAISRIWTSHGGEAGAAGGGITRLSGSEASASAFLSSAPKKRILHVATHGFFLEETCPKGDKEGSADPMLLSGLAFAGANQRREGRPRADDGIVTAEEIASLDLSSVEWVVLSACDTGVGEVRSGEGVLGLRRAFEISGAGTLIMSLWPVRDVDATAWMSALYEARFAGLDTSEAMRRAGLKILKGRREEGRDTHPASWGAFVAYGAWR